MSRGDKDMAFQSRPPSSRSGRPESLVVAATPLRGAGRCDTAGALEAGFEFAFQAVELIRGEITVAGGVDERAGGAG